jgi:predicted Ser/Thr protein kinase
MPEPKPYRRLNKFELHQLIGEGAMGVVWKAYDTVLRRYVALKLLGSSFAKTTEMRERFLREARAAGALQHPNIVTVYDLGEAEGQLFIAMELVEGRDLSDFIASREPLALERKLDIVVEMLQGLGYAHERGVIHRDVKPSNVRVTSDGSVKIMDFGIARLQTADATGSGAIIGTPTYMAPEQITNGPISPATDVFAVGCVLYELLTYQKPFEAESIHGVLYQVLTTDPKPLRTMAPSIPASLERVVIKAMAKAPRDRFDTAKHMRTTLLGIRSALSGAGAGTTQRLTGGRGVVFGTLVSLIRPMALRTRLLALGALALVVGVLAYFSLAAPPIAPPVPAPVSATPTVVATVPPPSVNPAVSALRDSARAARARAVKVFAMKNNVPAWLLAETILQTADRAVAAGDQPRASPAYSNAFEQYRLAARQADTMRSETARLVARVTPVVRALGTRPEAAAAVSRLARADSLLKAGDYSFAKLAAQDAEQIAVSLGVAPPSSQPADARAAIAILLLDLGRAVASERVANIKALYPGITAPEVSGWQRFFRSAEQLSARFTVERLSVRGASASAVVSGIYSFVPRGGGVQREDRPLFTMHFAKTAGRWRIASVREAPR